jgi:hypothetical protein
MGVNDGVVKGTTLIYDSGSTAERFNLVLVAEGYRESELGVFAKDCEDFVDVLFAEPPFDEFVCAINVFRVDVASKDSGANDPTACGGTGQNPKTYFDATFCTGGVRRALSCNTSLVQDVVQQQVPAYHSAQVIVNSPIYGGTGGDVGVSSHATKKDDGTPAVWQETVLHEMGHSIFDLADEYEYYQGCKTNETGHDKWITGEPIAENITASSTATGKWSNLLTTSTLPTTTNANCKKCDPQPNPVGEDVVGTFEGAGYYHCGLYRPRYLCKMRKLNEPFCPVCQRVIREKLAVYDPRFCLKRELDIDLSRWAIVATILFGIIQDGGGVIWVGGKPIPIDPWGPLYESLWGALADPRRARTEVLDVLAAIATRDLAMLFSEGELQDRMVDAATAAIDDAAAKLPSTMIR